MRSWVEGSESDATPSPLEEAVQTALAVFSPAALRDDERMQQYFEFALQMPSWLHVQRTHFLIYTR